MKMGESCGIMGIAAGEQARNNAMVRKGSPFNRLELDAVGTAK
jgi:hypothetical protein